MGKKDIDKQYRHALMVWDTFEMKRMKDFHDFYLKFRNSSLKFMPLRHYLSATTLSCGAMLNM